MKKLYFCIKNRGLISISLFVSLSFISCDFENKTSYQSEDPFVKNLQDSLTEIEASSKNVPVASSILELHKVEAVDDHDLLVIADNAQKTISLTNTEGEILSKAGGEGRGPEEFQSIAQLHVGQDKRIYLLDPFLFRVTIYEVDENELRYLKAVEYENPNGNFLYRIYDYDNIFYGLFKQHRDMQKPENKFLLYRLNDEFEPEEKLLELPGNQLRQLETGVSEFKPYVDHFVLSTTFWDAKDEWFYYITSYTSALNKYNLRTGTLEKISFWDSPIRENSRDHINSIKKHYDDIGDESFWAVLEDHKTLPLFSGFWVLNGKAILRVFYASGDEGMMLYFDPGSRDMRYFRTPIEISQLTTDGNNLYGIDFKTDGHYQLMRIDFKSRLK